MFVIYQITNLIDGKSYIGRTTKSPCSKRFGEHKASAKMGSAFRLHRAMRKHGIENFSFVVLEQHEKYVPGLEERYIAELSPKYNMTNGGEGTLGWVPTEQPRKKQSEANRGQIPWNKGKRGLQVAWNKGIRVPSISARQLGKIRGSYKPPQISTCINNITR